MTPEASRPWPRGLRRPAAADYVGVGVTKFDDWVARGLMPAPKRQDGVVVWDRLALDAAFDDLPSEGESRGGAVPHDEARGAVKHSGSRPTAAKPLRVSRRDEAWQALRDAIAAAQALPDDVPWRKLDCCLTGRARGEFEFHAPRCKAPPGGVGKIVQPAVVRELRCCAGQAKDGEVFHARGCKERAGAGSAAGVKWPQPLLCCGGQTWANRAFHTLPCKVFDGLVR